jgi:hypothetical protein
MVSSNEMKYFSIEVVAVVVSSMVIRTAERKQKPQKNEVRVDWNSVPNILSARERLDTVGLGFLRRESG